MVATHTSPVRLSSASEEPRDAPGRRAVVKIFHLPFSYRPSPFSVPAQIAVAIDADAEDVIVGQAIRGGEVLPAEARHVLGGAVSGDVAMTSNSESECVSHSVLRYSIRSFSSSLVRSLVTPCLSWD